MKRYWHLCAFLMSLAAFSGKLLAQGSVGNGPAGTAQTSHAILDSQMVTASAPSATSAQVQQSVDGVFALAGMPPSIADSYSVTSQIVASQIAYNNNNYASLSESNVVTAINDLSATLSLPDCTLTTSAEVRQLHVALLLAFPQFLLAGASAAPGNPTLVRTSFSPLEATLLFSMLLHQKLSNPSYQMSPNEYNRYYNALNSGSRLPRFHDHTQLINQAIQTAVINIGPINITQQINQVMSDLGLASSGGSN